MAGQMALHPPAMGGKTAWGVSDIIQTAIEDPEKLADMRRKTSEHGLREEERLLRIRVLENNAESIAADRQSKRSAFEMGFIDGADKFKHKNDAILARMLEMKETKRAEKKASQKTKKKTKKKPKKETKKGKKKKKKKKKKDSSSSSSDSSSSSSSGSSSSGSSSSSSSRKFIPFAKGHSAASLVKKSLKPLTKEERKLQAHEAKVEASQGLSPAERRAADEAKGREKEAKKKAKEELQAWRKLQAEKEAVEQAKLKEAAAKRNEGFNEEHAKKQEEARKKVEEEEQKKKEAEEAKAKEVQARKALFQTDSLLQKRKEEEARAKAPKLAGGFKVKDRVIASRDISIGGRLVVLAGTAGIIKGAADTDPECRVAVDWSKRQDGIFGCINCVGLELKRG